MAFRSLLKCPCHCSRPKEALARLLSWHAGEVKDIDDPSDYDDAKRAAELYAELGDPFREGQALLRAGSARLSTADDDGYAVLNST